MKTALVLLSLFTLGAAQKSINFNLEVDNKNLYDDELTITVDGKEELHIDEAYNLFIFGEKIETTRQERRMLEDYVELHRVILKKGVRIGKAGAKLGIKATAVALGATVEAIGALMSGDEDKADDIFEDMEDEIENRAKHIERMADDIEDLADDLEHVRRKLRRNIPELRKVHDF